MNNLAGTNDIACQHRKSQSAIANLNLFHRLITKDQTPPHVPGEASIFSKQYCLCVWCVLYIHIHKLPTQQKIDLIRSDLLWRVVNFTGVSVFAHGGTRQILFLGVYMALYS